MKFGEVNVYCIVYLFPRLSKFTYTFVTFQWQEAKRRAIENEKRRKKLEEMRESMAEDGSPIKPSPKPQRIQDPDGELTENVEGFYL